MRVVMLDASNPGEHPTRICYEFGVPCVVQAGNATNVLRAGQHVTVDGGRGWVLAVD
jgi:phosphohistidine swiveling domain-containing protein